MTKVNYHGIDIDYSRDALLDEFSVATLRDRYFYKGPLKGIEGLDGVEVDERSPQESFCRAALYGATFGGSTDLKLAQRLYDSASQLHFGFATPLLSNGGTRRGLPISCFLPFVPDSIRGIASHWTESSYLASRGGGIGSYWGSLRTNGESTSRGSKSNGMIPFLKVSDSQMFAVSQGTTRRGAYAAYLPIDHPEIEEFIRVRKVTGGDFNRKCPNLHVGVLIPDSFMGIVERAMEDPTYDDKWELIDPHSKAVTKAVSARRLWADLLKLRHEGGRGEPYIAFSDTLQEGLPQAQKDLGLSVVQSNLCTEITLPTNEERTAVCCLSSLNAETFNDWPKTLVGDLTTMLDNVIEHFIRYVSPNVPRNKDLSFAKYEQYVPEEKKGFARAGYSAYRERAVGLGMMGFHSWLQHEGVPFESALATSYNRRLFNYVKQQAEKTSKGMAVTRGSCPDWDGRRNTHLLAVAPTASNSIICGGVSAGIEPRVANYYVHKTDSGNFVIKNKALDKILKDRYTDVEDVWRGIRDADGSCQHLDLLSQEEKDVFKTAEELNQMWVIEHASQRQEFICQGQSVNLFFRAPQSEDEALLRQYAKYYNAVHLAAWKRGLKTLYYCRTRALKKAENVGLVVPSVADSDCLSCEG